ncbi:hypothetical protein G6F56_006452 [Rhizopus delemar]|nr:hypothetical protein G6F56_006452 [Rhizopus delemar]
MESLSHVVNNEEELFVGLMKEHSKAHGGADPANFCRLAAMNVTLAVAFGIPGSKDVSDPLYQEASYILNKVVEFASFAHDYSVMLPSLKFLDVLFSKQKQMEDFRDKVFHPFLRRIIKSALESKEDNLAKKLDQVKDLYQLDELNIIAIMSEVLAAGIGTTSDSTSWVIAILCNYPKVQEKLCDEIDLFMKKHGREPTFADREELPYFMAVAKECIRFRPAKDFGLPHKATEDVIYKDYVIPKGTVLFASMNTIHRDPDFYQDGDKFIPERYQDDTKTMYASSRGALKDRDHFTFGWGRRICPGIFVAENQIFLTIVKIMATCTIEPVLSPGGEKIYPELNERVGTTTTVHPLPYKVCLVERANRVILP